MSALLPAELAWYVTGRFYAAAATPIATPTRPGDTVVPFSGSAIALGG